LALSCEKFFLFYFSNNPAQWRCSMNISRLAAMS
jgi:hypothetical protein